MRNATMEENFQALHHQFVASAMATKIAHELNPELKVGCMSIYATMYAYDCHPDTVMERDIKTVYLIISVMMFKFEEAIQPML